MAIEIKAPNDYSGFLKGQDEIIFLGGVIDSGNAPLWQKQVVDALDEYDNILILNPRRDDWDASWEQSKDNPQFREQVEWELNGQNHASINVYVFAPDPETAPSCKAPVTLLELGLHASDDLTLVVCPAGYYRKGNVDIVCERCGIPVFETVDELIEELRSIITSL